MDLIGATGVVITCRFQRHGCLLSGGVGVGVGVGGCLDSSATQIYADQRSIFCFSLTTRLRTLWLGTITTVRLHFETQSIFTSGQAAVRWQHCRLFNKINSKIASKEKKDN